MTDNITILLYLCLIFFVAFKSYKYKGKAKDTGLATDQYLAGKSLTFWESLCSIVATEASALTFLGVPAFAYGKDFSFIHIYFGAIFGRFVIARYFIPKLYGKGLTVYSIMAANGGTNAGHKTLSSFYFISKALAIGVRLFAGSILVAQFFNISIYIAIVIICIITFIYTLVGGLKAVARTDILQLCLFVGGGILAHFMIPQIAESSWTDLMSQANIAGKLTIFDTKNVFSIITGLLGGFILDIITHGTDQDFAQRLMGNESEAGAKRAIIASAALSIIVGFIFLGVGALLWSYYQNVGAPEGVKPDKIFAYFITHHFPSPFKGLMVAGVLAASMSTLDSCINALSSCLWNDLWPHRGKDKMAFYYKLDTFLITALLMVIAFVSSQSDKILILGLKIVSWTGAPLLALFLSKLLFNKKLKTPLDFPAVFITYLMGFLGVYINTYIVKWPWQWNLYYGFALCMVFLYVYGLYSQRKSS